MAYVEAKVFVHRDLAARNVLINVLSEKPVKIEAKVSDFGLAKILHNKDVYKMARKRMTYFRFLFQNYSKTWMFFLQATSRYRFVGSLPRRWYTVNLAVRLFQFTVNPQNELLCWYFQRNRTFGLSGRPCARFLVKVTIHSQVSQLWFLFLLHPLFHPRYCNLIMHNSW